MKGTRVNGAVVSIRGQELREGVMEVVMNEGGNNVFISKWNDKEMMCPIGVKVILPARSWMGAWLGVSRGWHLILLVFHQFFDFHVLVRDLSI